MPVALPFPRPGPREPAPVTIAILPASRPLMSRRLLPLRGCAATACHTIEPDEGLPHEVTHVRSLRAQELAGRRIPLPVLERVDFVHGSPRVVVLRPARLYGKLWQRIPEAGGVGGS